MYPTDTEQILKAYEEAKRVYRGFGVDTDEALRQFREIPISLHCWQGDDVQGFEQLGDVASQNLVTGSYGGAARNARELRQDIDMAFSLSPCRHRVNLHSMYAEPKTPTPRNELTAEDFQNWIDWAKEQGYGLDFNASFFTHPMMVDGFSLASRRKDVRDYWIKAGIGARHFDRNRPAAGHGLRQQHLDSGRLKGYPGQPAALSGVSEGFAGSDFCAQAG